MPPSSRPSEMVVQHLNLVGSTHFYCRSLGLSPTWSLLGQTQQSALTTPILRFPVPIPWAGLGSLQASAVYSLLWHPQCSTGTHHTACDTCEIPCSENEGYVGKSWRNPKFIPCFYVKKKKKSTFTTWWVPGNKNSRQTHHKTMLQFNSKF